MAEEDPTAPENDPDFISTDGPRETYASAGFAPIGLAGAPAPVFMPTSSTRLDEDDAEGVIPHAPLWSMKYHRHFHLFDRTDARIRDAFGQGDHAIYVIDDGRRHCVVGRIIGAGPDGCTYCLVAQITIEAYDRLVSGEDPIDRVFADARGPAVCAVFEAAVEGAPSNVTLTEQYPTIDDVPPEYRSPSPFIEFVDDLDEED